MYSHPLKICRAEFSELLCERSLQLLQWKVPAISTKLCLHQLIDIAFPYPSIHLCKILFPKALSSYSRCHSLKNRNNRSVYTQNTGHVLYITPICGTNHHFFLFISINSSSFSCFPLVLKRPSLSLQTTGLGTYFVIIPAYKNRPKDKAFLREYICHKMFLKKSRSRLA